MTAEEDHEAEMWSRRRLREVVNELDLGGPPPMPRDWRKHPSMPDVAGLVAELSGWKTGSEATDDARRMVWLMHKAAAEIERMNKGWHKEWAEAGERAAEAERRGRIAGLREAAEIAHAHTARVAPSQAICELADRLEREDVK